MSEGRQAAFYHSKAWKRARAAYLDNVDGICERCGRPAAIVHHRRYITPEMLDDPGTTLDFANLEALCRDCHNKEHFEGRSCEPGMYFDTNGDLVEVARR